MSKQVWDTKVHLLGGEVLYTHLYVYVNPAHVQGAALENAFTFQADVRAAGVDLFSTGEVPLKNGAITANPTAPGGGTLGKVQGEIDDWNFSDGNWSTCTGVHFLVAAKADVVVAASDIAKLVPGFGGLIGGFLGLFGSKVRITVGHENVLIPIARDGTGKVTAINKIPVP